MRVGRAGRLAAVLLFSIVAMFGLWDSPAVADGTSGSFCYESGTLTVTSSWPHDQVTYNASITYRNLYTCSGTQVGVHVLSSTMSYSGGFNGTGDHDSKHGMDQTGIDYMRAGDPAGDLIYPGSVFAVEGYPRSYTYSADKYIYSGTGHNDQQWYSFADTAAFAYYRLPFSQLPFGPSTNVWYIFLRDQWVVYG